MPRGSELSHHNLLHLRLGLTVDRLGTFPRRLEEFTGKRTNQGRQFIQDVRLQLPTSWRSSSWTLPLAPNNLLVHCPCRHTTIYSRVNRARTGFTGCIDLGWPIQSDISSDTKLGLFHSQTNRIRLDSWRHNDRSIRGYRGLQNWQEPRLQAGLFSDCARVEQSRAQWP